MAKGEVMPLVFVVNDLIFALGSQYLNLFYISPSFCCSYCCKFHFACNDIYGGPIWKYWLHPIVSPLSLFYNILYYSSNLLSAHCLMRHVFSYLINAVLIEFCSLCDLKCQLLCCGLHKVAALYHMP